MKTLKLMILSSLLSAFSFAFQAHSETEAEYEFSQAELDQILAPIALYPDTVLSHVLIASTYPLEVIQADRWSREHPDLLGDAALKAVDSKDWDPSVKALVPFPQILKKMSEDLDWMQKLGDAFLQNEELVLASIQDLRQRAYDEGSLENLEHLSVSREEEKIVIEPTVREIVYVPYYDTRVVYGNWWWVDYPPVYSAHHHNHHYSGAHFYWGPRIHVGTGFYFSSVHWHHRRVVVVDRHYAHNHRFYSGRQVVRNSASRDWVHNTRHRRGVEYRHPRVREVNRTASYRTQRDQREAQQVSQRLQHNNSRTGVYENRTREHAERVQNEGSNPRVKYESNNKWKQAENGSRQTPVNTDTSRTTSTQRDDRQNQASRSYPTERERKDVPTKYERPTERTTSERAAPERTTSEKYERSRSDNSSNNRSMSSNSRSERSANNVSRHSRTESRNDRR